MNVNNWFWVGVVVPIVIAILASLPALLVLMDKNKNQKNRGDALQTYKDLVDEQAKEWDTQRTKNRKLEDEINELREEIACWRDIFKRWEAGISLLINQVLSLGKEPVWKPTEEDHNCIEKGKKK